MLADFTKQELEKILIDTQEHLAETKRIGPGYYRIRERYDYAIEADERYIEKLKKQIADYDQDKLNENQQIVLEWLKDGDNSPFAMISTLDDDFVGIDTGCFLPSKVREGFEALTNKEQFEILAAFAKRGMKEVAE